MNSRFQKRSSSSEPCGMTCHPVGEATQAGHPVRRRGGPDRRYLHAVLLGAALLALAAPASAVQKTWTGAAGNKSWSDAKNWNPPGKPGPDDEVVIPKDSGEIHMPNELVKVKKLTIEDCENEDGTVLKGTPLPGHVRIKVTGKVYIGLKVKVVGGKGHFVEDEEEGNLSDGEGGGVDIDGGDDVTNKGKVEGGPGAPAGKPGTGGEKAKEGGSGGKVKVKAKGTLVNDGKITGGPGGAHAKKYKKGGSGGSAEAEDEDGHKSGEGSGVSGGPGGVGNGDDPDAADPKYKGKDGSTVMRSVASTEVLPGTLIAGDSVVIEVGPGGVITLAGLPPESIVAAREVFINAGDGEGLIDLRGIPAGANVITAGLCVHVIGTVLTDPGVELADITEPDAVTEPDSCQMYFSEIVVNPPEAVGSKAQSVEIQAAPFARLLEEEGIWFVAISGDPESAGVLTAAVPLSDLKLGASGVLLLRAGDMDLNPPPEPDTTILTLGTAMWPEPAKSITYALLYGAAEIPAEGDDLDFNDDGTLDVSFKGAFVLDGISFADPDGTGREYGDDLGGVALGSVGDYVPDALYSIPWYMPWPPSYPPLWCGGRIVGDAFGPWSWDAVDNFGWDELGVAAPEELTLHLGAPNDLILPARPPYDEWFDDYPAGMQMHGVGGWKGWDSDPTLGAVLTEAPVYSGSNAVQIVGATDLVHEFFGATGGRWIFRVWSYVPGDFKSGGEKPYRGSHVILLNTYYDGGPYNWSMQLHADSDTSSFIRDGVEPAALPLVKDTWVEIRAIIDLDHDSYRVFYAGQELGVAESWSAGVLGEGDGQLNVAALDLFAYGSSPVYYDDVMLVWTYAVGDVNCDGAVNAFDIDPFVLALTDPAGYQTVYPLCDLLNADINLDGAVNAFDIDPFVELLTGD